MQIIPLDYCIRTALSQSLVILLGNKEIRCWRDEAGLYCISSCRLGCMFSSSIGKDLMLDGVCDSELHDLMIGCDRVYPQKKIYQQTHSSSLHINFTTSKTLIFEKSSVLKRITFLWECKSSAFWKLWKAPLCHCSPSIYTSNILLLFSEVWFNSL